MRNGERQRPCSGGGQQAQHTYSARQRTSGGGERAVTLANCPVDHDRHYDLQITPAGRVVPHAQ
jgi:hypothetical protein